LAFCCEILLKEYKLSNSTRKCNKTDLPSSTAKGQLNYGKGIFKSAN
jgi:hypothetical protein